MLYVASEMSPHHSGPQILISLFRFIFIYLDRGAVPLRRSRHSRIIPLASQSTRIMDMHTWHIQVNLGSKPRVSHAAPVSGAVPYHLHFIFT